MKAEKDEERLLKQAIQEWQDQAIVSPEQAEKMLCSIQPRHSERQQLAQYFFIIAVSSALLAFGALFLDEKLLEHFRKLFFLSNYTIAVGAALLAVISYWFARHRRNDINPTTYEVYLLPGALSTLIALVYLFKEMGNGPAYTHFTGCTILVFAILSLSLNSRLLWVATLAALMGWFGAFSTVHSQHDLFLGMNYPLRFTVFGLVVIGLSLVQHRFQVLEPFRWLSYHTGLLIFFTGLWGLAIFGNFNSLAEWQRVRQSHMLVYALVSGLIISACLLLGIYRNDRILRDYSILFLLLSLYSHYFEYFWDSVNKGIFFLILAVSFGLLARWLSKSKAVD